MTPEERFDRVFASAMQDRQALLRFLDGVTGSRLGGTPRTANGRSWRGLSILC